MDENIENNNNITIIKNITSLLFTYLIYIALLSLYGINVFHIRVGNKSSRYTVYPVKIRKLKSWYYVEVLNTIFQSDFVYSYYFEQ